MGGEPLSTIQNVHIQHTHTHTVPNTQHPTHNTQHTIRITQTRPTLPRLHNRSGISLEYLVLFVPCKGLVCERVFQEEGVYGDVTLAEVALQAVPLDNDVLSLELDYGLQVMLCYCCCCWGCCWECCFYGEVSYRGVVFLYTHVPTHVHTCTYTCTHLYLHLYTHVPTPVCYTLHTLHSTHPPHRRCY